MKFDAVVVVYNPDDTIIKNINSYVKYVDSLYIIDNSDTPNLDLIDKILNLSRKCEYISNKGNQGIAYALNKGAELAINNGANWLLTMDQDTSFEGDDCKTLVDTALNTDIKSVAIIAPSHQEDESTMNIFYDTMAMTSGNLINLEIYKSLNGFDNNLFIDSVDVDYCLKVYANKYLIKRLPNIILSHNLGNTKKYNICGISFSPTNHNYIRRYYITRNRLHVWSKYKEIYPAYITSEKVLTFKEFVKIIMFEENKLKKMRFMIKGYIDYRNNRFGKLEK